MHEAGAGKHKKTRIQFSLALYRGREGSRSPVPIFGRLNKQILTRSTAFADSPATRVCPSQEGREGGRLRCGCHLHQTHEESYWDRRHEDCDEELVGVSSQHDATTAVKSVLAFP